MPIEIYASKFAAEPAERHETNDRMTVAAWLRANDRFRFFMSAQPLRLPGAVGSPANAVGIV